MAQAEQRSKVDTRVLSDATILLTGASSGLGAALALHYAQPGRRLLLWGRDATRLDAVADRCRSRGAVVQTRRLDLTDSAGILSALLEDDDKRPIELAILAAGLGDIQGAREPTEQPEHVIALGLVNFVAATAMATALARRMAARGGGQVVLIGSVAAFHALPFAATYCGSKAGLCRFAAALRHGMAPRRVGVTLISPGFIDTPMSRRLTSTKPFLLSPQAAALQISLAAKNNRAHLVLPWPFIVLRIVDRILPSPLRRFILSRLHVEQTKFP